MNNHVHIYTAGMQPATSYVDRVTGHELRGGFDPETLLYTQCCNKRRPAKDLLIQIYYDSLPLWCAPGCGCKDPVVIEAKRKKEFENRSAGQKKRWNKSVLQR